MILMQQVQRMTYFGCQIKDFHKKKNNKKILDCYSKEEILEKYPTFLETLSYIMSFLGFTNPSVNMREHLDFMNLEVK